MAGIPFVPLPQVRSAAPGLPAAPHVFLQALGLLLFGGFAIVATTLGFVFFWPAGFVLALALGWLGFAHMSAGRAPRHAPHSLPREAASPRDAETGNGAFDAYRHDVLARLEDEQRTFIRFLDRLREAKDKTEFDTFMEDRARANALREGDTDPQSPLPTRDTPAR